MGYPGTSHYLWRQLVSIHPCPPSFSCLCQNAHFFCYSFSIPLTTNIDPYQLRQAGHVHRNCKTWDTSDRNVFVVCVTTFVYSFVFLYCTLARPPHTETKQLQHGCLADGLHLRFCAEGLALATLNNCPKYRPKKRMEKHWGKRNGKSPV